MYKLVNGKFVHTGIITEQRDQESQTTQAARKLDDCRGVTINKTEQSTNYSHIVKVRNIGWDVSRRTLIHLEN